MMRGLITLMGSCGLLVSAWPTAAAPAEEPFVEGQVWKIRLEVPADGINGLRRQPRQFVQCTFHEGSTVLSNVALRLKGSIGSFRPIDDKPAFTLDFEDPDAGKLPFRFYRDDEPVDLKDIVYTRKFLDLRGVIEANDFDAALLRVDTPA